MRLALVASLVLLSGCGGPSLSKNQRAEVENIAEDFADGASSDSDASTLQQRIEDLEERMEIADRSNQLAINQISQLSRNGVKDAKAIADISNEYNDHLDRYH